MAIVEIRCPRCGSPSHLQDEKSNEYHCENCGSTFRFVDTNKRQVLRDIVGHNCPICGRPVKAGKGYVCKRCGKEDLCKNCTDTDAEDKLICKDCLKESKLDCHICGKFANNECVVCGIRSCYQCAFSDFDVDACGTKEEAQILNRFRSTRFSLSCPTCISPNGWHYVCNKCYDVKTNMRGEREFYCKKCGSKLNIEYPKYFPSV